jgi:hypothetical protein
LGDQIVLNLLEPETWIGDLKSVRNNINCSLYSLTTENPSIVNAIKDETLYIGESKKPTFNILITKDETYHVTKKVEEQEVVKIEKIKLRKKLEELNIRDFDLREFMVSILIEVQFDFERKYETKEIDDLLDEIWLARNKVKLEDLPFPRLVEIKRDYVRPLRKLILDHFKNT